nr:hypothetical protein [Desulfobacter hydrogenophilus]
MLEIWKLVVRRVRIKYEPQYWGMVFPLGMYTTCTYQLADALDFRFLMLIPHYFIYLALLAWLFTFIGLHRMLFRSLFSNVYCKKLG